MADFGIPYMGSKHLLTHKLAAIFPKAENFYDLFGGGFSVTHFMILHRYNSYKRFFFNEIEPSTIKLIQDAIAGKYNYKVFKPKFITREDFFNNLDDAYVRILWSFGNNNKRYLFGKDVEPAKHSLHNAVVFGDFDDFAKKTLRIDSWPDHLSIKGRRLYCKKLVQKYGRFDLEQLERLERLEQLEQLERLQQLEQLQFSSKSYDEIEILPNSVVYCDPPYIGTEEYTRKFDHVKFWAWFRAQKEPVFVSEYTAPSDIKVIAAFHHNKKLSSKTNGTKSVEKLYGNDAAFESFKSQK